MAENLAGISVGAGGGGTGEVGSCPHLQTRGAIVSNAPHFADLWNDACKHGKT